MLGVSQLKVAILMGGAMVFSLILAYLFIPQIIKMAYNKNLMDEPEGRKWHKKPVPQLGGIAFPLILSFVVGLIFALGKFDANLSLVFQEMKFLQNSLSINLHDILFLFLSMELLCIMGVFDDLQDVSYRKKFVVQLLSGTLLYLGGFSMPSLFGLLGIYTLAPAFSFLFTLFIVVLFINAVNLIDGIDGLASGLSSIALLFYGLVFFLYKEYFYSLISFSFLGILIAFFYFNVFGSVEKKKKIFMGDTGSYIIGGILAALSLKLAAASGGKSYNLHEYSRAFIIAFVPLFLMCFDVLRVFITRLLKNRSPFHPDRKHIHHLFLKAGFSEGQTLVFILLLSVFYIVSNLSVYVFGLDFSGSYFLVLLELHLLLLFDLAFWFLLCFFLKKRGKKLRAKQEKIN